MSRIDKLIDELCPNGVEYKELGDVAVYRRGSFPQPYTESNWYGGEDSMPFVQVADVANDMHLVSVTKQRISKLAQPKSVFVPAETVVVTLQGSIGRVAITQYDSYVDRTLAIFEKYKIKIDKKYFAYQLERKFGIEKEFARGSTIKTITKEELTKFSIPFPPLPIQQEIVNILDKFTALDAELQAELEARKKQYEYYRNQILNFEEKEVEWKTLGEIMAITRGASPRPIDNYFTNDNDGISWIKIGDVNPNSKYITQTKQKITIEGAKKSRFLKKGDFVLSNSMSFGRPYILSIDGCIHDGWISMQNFEQKLVSDYLFHILSSDLIQKYWMQKVSSGTVQNLNADIVKTAIIPIPSIFEQRRIAKLLDKFEELVNTGLPTEIEARRKQYEYYREKLLSFKVVSD